MIGDVEKIDEYKLAITKTIYEIQGIEYAPGVKATISLELLAALAELLCSYYQFFEGSNRERFLNALSITYDYIKEFIMDPLKNQEKAKDLAENMINTMKSGSA